ncbi:phage capsid family protein [Bradyrhizobium elkanii]
MALTTTQTNNKLIEFTKQVNREWVRDNLFAPYMGTDITAIIRKRMELTSGGEQMNIPLVARLQAQAVGSGALAGNEESIDNYGMRVWIDWARNAVKTNKAEKQKDSAAIFGVARPLLSDWIKELNRDEIIQALYALPTESAPAGLGSAAGQRVNGILFDAATAAQRNTWVTDNGDRVVFGNANSNYSTTFATATATLDSTNDIANAANMRFLKRVARAANPKIRPFKIKDGREYFVAFHGSRTFRDLKASLDTININARSREGDGLSKNPLFQDGDQLYDGVIHREVPEIDTLAPVFYATAGASGTTAVRPVWLCGQSAVAMAYGQMAKPTQLDNTDYQFNQGVGIESAYGVAKMFKKTSGGAIKEWGICTGFYAATPDA